MHAVEHMRWETFTRLFYEEHFLQLEHNMLRYQFERLEQGTMMVAEYRSEFCRLERFAPSICATEAERARRFQDRLDIENLCYIAATIFPTWTAVVDAATRQEMILRRQGKRLADP